jgi:transposase
MFCDNLLAALGIPKISGMGNFWGTIWQTPMVWIWGCVNVRECSITWGSVFESLVLLLPRRTRWLKRHIKKLHRYARDENVDIWSLDECHFQQHGTRCVMWVPPEETDPILLHAPTRKSVALFGAVNLHFGQLVTQFHSVFDGITFEVFLQTLLRHRRHGRRLIVTLDNAPYHHGRSLAPFLEKHRRVLRLLFLPPYSPDLNPIERVWKLTRRLCTHNQYFPELHDLVTAVSNQMKLWYRPNSTLVKLCGII